MFFRMPFLWPAGENDRQFLRIQWVAIFVCRHDFFKSVAIGEIKYLYVFCITDVTAYAVSRAVIPEIMVDLAEKRQ